MARPPVGPIQTALFQMSPRRGLMLIDLAQAWISDDVAVQPIYDDHIAALDRARNVFGTDHSWDRNVRAMIARVAGPAAQIGCQP